MVKALDKKAIGDRIFRGRKLLGMTRRDLAAEIEVHPQTIYWFEKGNLPSLANTYKLCQMFRLSLDELVLGDPEKEVQPKG